MIRLVQILFALILVWGSVGPLPMQAQTDTPKTCQKEFDSGLKTIETTFDGEVRRYLIYVPESLNTEVDVPLVLSLHGFTSNSRQQMQFSQWNPVADEHGFIVVYPQGEGFPSRWSSGQQVMDVFQDRDDVGFIQQVITEVSDSYCIDSTRIYINGLSNGGGMTNRMACETTDLFAAVGMVSGAYTPMPEGCNPSRPMPIIAFHGTLDPIVPYSGGKAGGFDLPDVITWAAEWAMHDGCDLTPEQLSTPLDVDYTAIRYGNCDDSVEVVFYTIHGGGHTWPGGESLPEFIVGKLSQDLNASELMWEFFSQYALAETG